MTKLYLTIVLLSLSILSTHARVGETLEELTKRYGEGREISARVLGTVQMEYHKNGFIIHAIIADKHAIWEMFKRESGKINDTEINELLSINASGHAWNWHHKEHAWLREDRKLKAFREPGHDDWFFIQDIEETKSAEAKAKNHINGF